MSKTWPSNRRPEQTKQKCTWMKCTWPEQTKPEGIMDIMKVVWTNQTKQKVTWTQCRWPEHKSIYPQNCLNTHITFPWPIANLLSTCLQENRLHTHNKIVWSFFGSAPKHKQGCICLVGKEFLQCKPIMNHESHSEKTNIISPMKSTIIMGDDQIMKHSEVSSQSQVFRYMLVFVIHHCASHFNFHLFSHITATSF